MHGSSYHGKLKRRRAFLKLNAGAGEIGMRQEKSLQYHLNASKLFGNCARRKP